MNFESISCFAHDKELCNMAADWKPGQNGDRRIYILDNATLSSQQVQSIWLLILDIWINRWVLTNQMLHYHHYMAPRYQQVHSDVII